ncbi:Regulator of chromosome condensation 1/beta-lactamase-inhibitor protein II [Cynara cardunculus var. scolymus]|uniref:Regulator of chromosome condensation 1/beta-lactamase-inhibitor protein II n=1 Tax=Cynara cardunculus var. scolymus TaxID=59895 RepID=A0A103YIV0_CYNCS|nr:Regulator of chromosome condensation 1/beta-lactamase-inhibitor protein II [Cynara cardunculus var. scolymus]
MNGEGDEDMKMEMKCEEKSVYMWGYLPGALPQRSPILSPVEVRLPQSIDAGRLWADVCGGGCGFAMAISDTGKLITWGSTDDLGQSYVTSGKHGETPEPFPLPKEVSIVRAAAGWAHCACVTVAGEVYTWGWKECVPSGKVVGDPNTAQSQDKDVFERQNPFLTEQGNPISTLCQSLQELLQLLLTKIPKRTIVSPRSHGSRSTGGAASGVDGKAIGDENTKRRRVSSTKQVVESSSSGDEPLSALPCLVALNPGVRIATVAAGGRHTLALSDIGQVWGWGYGGEGQLGLGSRIRMVSSPHPIPCIATSSVGKDRSAALPRGSMGSEGQGYRVPGNYIKGIACGGRHSAVVTDAGALMTFGWGLYGQCGQGSTDDELSPTCVSSLLGIRIEGVAAGLWHTICISADGDVYAFGGNQFGQLGTGTDQAETLPRLLDAPSLENEHARVVSCGARHSAVLGLGDVIDRNIPSQVALEGCVPRTVACGWWHILLLAEPLT